MITTKFLCFYCVQDFSEDSVDRVIESDTDSSDFDGMSLRVQKWTGDRTIVLGLTATIIPMDEPSNGDSRPRSNLASPDIVDKEARAKYMREWQRHTRLKRLEARDAARSAPRRSPRLSNLT